jgi:pilus assembly protein FimV
VSLDQMLVALYRGNPQAFTGDNINRLKAGVVLAVPSADTVAAIDSSEARRFIVAQSSDFGSFRQKLAAAVPEVRSDASARKDAGKVQARVDDAKAGLAAVPDKLTLSKPASAPGAAVPEARISAEREKQDAAARVAELSRNVEELKKLSGAAGVGAQASAGASAADVTPPQPTPAIEAPVVVTPPAASSALESASQPESPPSAAQAASAAPKPPQPAASAGSAPAPAIAVEEEPSFLSELLENNLTSLIAGGAALLALIGFGVFRSRRSSADAGETSFLESRLQPDSFFGASGGQRIDTREAAGVAGSSSMSYSLSQLDAIGDVDPVQEADVYLAYGRDLQAEEILREAMRSTPERLAIRTKLLEVYAKRRDTKGFELLALQLYPLTGGAGDDWANAQQLGLEIDPGNPLYQEGGAPPSNLPDAAGLDREPLDVTTMPQTVQPSPSTFADSVVERTEALNSQAATDVREQPLPQGEVDLHLDLDLDDLVSETPAPAAPLTFQFEDTAAPQTPPGTLPFESLDDFDVDLSAAEPVSGTGVAAKPVDPVAANPFSLSELELTPAPAPSAATPMEFDLSAISLDLDDGSVSSTAEPPAESLQMADGDDAEDDADDEGDPLARKLELAEEFRQIGDIEGARDLLQEVVADATGALKARAEALLKDLA